MYVVVGYVYFNIHRWTRFSKKKIFHSTMVLQCSIDQKHNICESGSEKRVLSTALKTTIIGKLFQENCFGGPTYRVRATNKF